MTGRPSTFSQDIADEICEHIAMGKSMRSVIRLEEERQPEARRFTMSTVFKWLRDYDSFSQQYARACEERAEAFAEEVIDIADGADTDQAAVQRDRLRVDTRKWIMARMKPKKYGDRVDLNHSGNIGIAQILADIDGNSAGLPSQDRARRDRDEETDDEA